MSLDRKKIIKNLNHTYESKQYIIAIAAGCGISAKYAAANGVDLILALNSGKYRQMGLSSLAGMMPFSNSNNMVLEFASKEIIPQIIQIPVIFGVCATDPTINLDRFIDKIIDNGFSGVNNFPTVGLIDGRFREVLEEEGFAYQKEIEAIRIAHSKKLFTTAFVFSVDQALMMAEAGADVICVHLGFTRGGVLGVKHYLSLHEASVMAKEIFDELDRQRINVIKLVYGGPIQTPVDAKFVLENSGSMGFIGGSSFERIPNEKAISEVTAQFKSLSQDRDLVVNKLYSERQNYDYVEFIKKFVVEHFMEEIHFKDLAQLLHVSRNYLSYLFKKEMGCSFPAYLQSVRMNMAKEIAESQDSISIKNLSELVGYSDQSYFSKRFKETFGVSPQNYTKK